MRQKVTLGYFERDEAGRMQSRSRAVIVEAASGDDAAAKALAEHGPELEQLSGYDPEQATGRVAVLGVDTPSSDTPAENPVIAPKPDGKKSRRPR